MTFNTETQYKIHQMKIIQAYAPTLSHADEEVEIFYEHISSALNETNTHFTILCGDFNAKLDLKSNESETSLRNFRSEGRNERGETMLSFLLQNNLFQMNSFFYKKSQNGHGRVQKEKLIMRFYNSR